MSARIRTTAETECIDHGLKGNAQGYGRTFVRGENRKMLSHRFAFWQRHGYLPPVVMHTCDNPRCINVEHLQAGNWDLNNKDRAAKGRSATAPLPKRKLTMADAEVIRSRFASRERRDPINGPSALAREYGVDCNVIYQIASGRTYRA